MEAVALAEPQTIKISSKRQITIPAQLYKELGFGEYALCTWTDHGILIQPLTVDEEDISIGILRDLIRQGFEGEELVTRYAEEQKKLGPMFKALVAKAEEELRNPENYGHTPEDLFE